MSVPAAFVNTPNRRPRKGGIFTVADEVQVPRLAAADHVEWIGDPCELPHQFASDCWGVTSGGDVKDPAGIDTLKSSPVYTIYAGVECYIGPDDDFEARAQQALLQGRDRVIEAKLNEYLEGLISGQTPPTFDTATSLLHGIEGWADDDYVGQPTILMDRGNADTAAHQHVVDWDRDGNIWTPNGTPVLASASISTLLTFIVGQITVYTTPVTVSRGNNLAQNRTMAIAEQSFAVGIDCAYVRAAQYDGSADGGGDGGSGTPGKDGVGIDTVTDNGDGTFTFTLTDGTVTDPIATIPGQDGTDGTNGTDGVDGTKWFTGTGNPVEPIAGANPGDLYLNTTSGDVFDLEGAA